MPRNEKLRRHPELVSIAASLLEEASKMDHTEADLVPFFRALDQAMKLQSRGRPVWAFPTGLALSRSTRKKHV